MMQNHSGGGMNGSHKGMPKDVSSYEIRLKSKKQIAKGTYEFTFEKPDGFIYPAGKHGRMTLINPPETDNEGNARFLSFSSAPSEPDLKFALRMRDTAFKRVLGSLRPGEKVLWQMRAKMPHGSFALQDAADAAKPAVFLIGGIGIVPVFSMLKDTLQHGAKHKITLIYSNRRPEDAPYLKDLQQLATRYPSVFTFVPTMSEPEKSSQSWQGETGRITQELVRKYVSDLQIPIFYIAGLTEMVAAMQKLLADAGVDKTNIRAEEFGAFTMAHRNQQPANKTKWAIVLIAALVVIMVVAHIVGASSLVKAGQSKKHIEVQVMVGLAVVMAVVVFIKVKLIRKHFRRSK